MLDLAIDDRLFLDTALDCAIQECDMLFNTTNSELIGYPEYGTNFEQFLWKMMPSEEEIKIYVNKKIQETLFLSKMHIETEVEILQGKVRDIYNITIKIENPNKDKESQESWRQRIYSYQ